MQKAAGIYEATGHAGSGDCRIRAADRQTDRQVETGVLSFNPHNHINLKKKNIF